MGTPTTTVHPGFVDLGFRFLYVGKEGVQWDGELGLHLMGARHYAPSLGRFMQPDPSALEENLLAYTENSPVTYADPADWPGVGRTAQLRLCRASGQPRGGVGEQG